MPMVTLAPEIVEIFLSFINEDENRLSNLSSCALVCQTWRSIAQPLLFSEIYVTASPYFAQERGCIKNSGALVTTLNRHAPHLSQLVSRYRVIGTGGEAYKDVVAITRTLTHLQDLQISRSLTQNSGAGVTVALQRVLPIALSSTRLTKLRIFHINDFPIHLFQHCRALRHLSIEHTTLAGLDEPVTKPKERIQLHTFTYGSMQSRSERRVLPWLTNSSCPFDLSELRVFLGSPTEHIITLFPSSRLDNLRAIEIPIKAGHEKDSVSWTIGVLSNLVAPEPFQNLEKVAVIAYLNRESTDHESTTVLPRSFPLLRAKNMLTVEVSYAANYASVILGPLP
ncbi:hypothetical protein BDN72DRAFT_856391 [Pluteus cervinus]|uniref:Uncharacterized protein n=1 Tax=Pluteus cervinus TaxID=181527 RepID=A0ACD3B0E2_9AGAR|nr:hypothetical protein BDN72DRAFT_856391 [Pluteus cervinus]